MGLRDSDDAYNHADTSGGGSEYNGMPDGRYALKITGVKVEQSKDGQYDIIKFNAVVDDETNKFHGMKAQASFMFGSGDNIHPARNLKYLTSACELAAQCPPSAFESQQICNLFIGFVLTAAKKTNEVVNPHSGKSKLYTNWNYWNLVSKPDGIKIPATAPKAAPLPDEEIDLSDEPF
jgi:hypothetical protein